MMVCSNHFHMFSTVDLHIESSDKSSQNDDSDNSHLLVMKTRSSRGPRRGQRCNKHSANMPSLLRRSRLPVDDNDGIEDNDNNDDDHDEQIQPKT